MTGYLIHREPMRHTCEPPIRPNTSLRDPNRYVPTGPADATQGAEDAPQAD